MVPIPQWYFAYSICRIIMICIISILVSLSGSVMQLLTGKLEIYSLHALLFAVGNNSVANYREFFSPAVPLHEENLLRERERKKEKERKRKKERQHVFHSSLV